MNEDLVLAITMLIILAVVVLFIQISQQIKVKRIQKIMRCDSDSGKKLIKSMVLRTADRQGMC